MAEENVPGRGSFGCRAVTPYCSGSAKRYAGHAGSPQPTPDKSVTHAGKRGRLCKPSFLAGASRECTRDTPPSPVTAFLTLPVTAGVLACTPHQALSFVMQGVSQYSSPSAHFIQ